MTSSPNTSTPKKVKLTPKQLEILRKMAEGATLHWMCGIRSKDHARLRTDHVNLSMGYPVRADYVGKFMREGLITLTSDPQWSWRSKDFKISEKGIEASK